MPEKRLDIGTHRICSPQDTIERWKPILSDFGITRIANVTGLDRIGIPVTLAIRPNSRSVAVSQGKGVTLSDATASAMMEAIEIWHAEHFDKSILYGKEAVLGKTNRIVNTNRLQMVKGAEYRPSDPMLWVEGFDCVSDEAVLVPYEMVHADYTRPGSPIHGTFHASTNGLASGNHRLEAICHALTELIERDALTLWHQREPVDQHSSRVDIASIDNEVCKNLVNRYEECGLDCGIWNVTSDISVPCMLAIVSEPNNQNGHIGLGSGCHINRDVAMRRALTEAAQTRLNYVSGGRDDLELFEYSSEGMAAKQDFANRLFSATGKNRSFQEVPTNTFSSLEEDFEHLLFCLQSAGLSEIIAVELTRPEYGVEVYRLIVPGLEAPHDDVSYQPGERSRIVCNGQ